MHPSNRSARPNIGFFSLLALSDFFLPSSIIYLPSTIFPPLSFDSFGNQGQKQPIPNRFTGPGKDQRVIGIGWVDESGGKWDVADPGVESGKGSRTGRNREGCRSRRAGGRA